MEKAPRVTLEQWRTLKTVIDEGGFAQAAQRLHRSQSSVSYAIHKLQDQLGVTLLRVEGRRARLTEAGEALLRRSRRLLQEAAQIEAFAHCLDEGWEPDIRLVVDAAFPPKPLMEALKAFAPLSQGTRVQLQEVVLSDAGEALEREQAELVIGTEVPQGFLGERLLSVEFVAVAHPAHALNTLGRELGGQDLERELQVVVRSSGLDCGKEKGWLNREQRWSVTSIDTALTAITQGLGFGWLPRHKITHALNEGVLCPLPLREGRIYSVDLFLIFGRAEFAGPATRLLADILRGQTAGALDGPRVQTSPLEQVS